MKMAMLMVIACSIAASCSAHPSNPSNREDSAIKKDSVMRKAMGDSIYAIISDAKKIKAEVIKLETDSTSLQNTVFVKNKHIPLIKFVLSDPQIYSVSTPAYGSFMPCFSLTFIRRKESCTAEFDFGLRKWSVCDDKRNNLKTFDLSSNDMLRVADLLFPNSKHLQSLINTEKK